MAWKIHGAHKRSMKGENPKEAHTDLIKSERGQSFDQKLQQISLQQCLANLWNFNLSK